MPAKFQHFVAIHDRDELPAKVLCRHVFGGLFATT
jgi:hypothetical protein